MSGLAMREPAFWWRSAGIYSASLTPLALVYGTIAGLRLAKTGSPAKIPVLCVGNFTLGGAGKTPTAIMLARMLAETGERPFFLSRGYGGIVSGPRLVDARSDVAAQVGDEPLLLAKIAPAVVARDRIAGAGMAITHGATIVVMDDGLQNASLAKDFTLAVVDARRGIGNARVFPAGPLRASLAAQLAKTNALLVVGKGVAADSVVAEARLRGLPILHGRLVPDPTAVAALKEHKVLAFAGIGDPEKFFDTARSAGIAVAEYRAFDDHHRYTGEDARDLVMQAERAGLLLLTTEKDRARIAGEPSLEALAARLHELPVTMVLDEPDVLRRLITAKLRR
jgi:tetraacyldisaccharide 4'-kinase